MKHFLPILILSSAFLILPFTTHAAWFNSNYQYCRPLTMTAGGGSGGVATTTTNGFAFVATSTISTLAATSSSGRIFETSTASGTTTPVDVALTNGTDCNDDGGTLLDFYFEKYVETTGEFVLWVEPDDISSTTAKTVLMYYGYADASATDQSNENGVFGGLGEAAVWSLSQGDSTSADFYTNSVVNDHHGTLTDSDGNVTSSTGYLGGGIDFSGDSGDVISMGTSLDTNYPFTMLTWIQPQSAAGFKTIFSKRDAPEAASARWEIALNPTSNAVYIYTGTGGQTNATLAPATNVWTHVGLKSSDTSSWELFGNGAFQENLGAQTIGSGSGATVRIGATNTDNSNNMNGQVDDLRLYARNLDPMDILTIYNNTVDSTTFWTFGDEETEVGGEAPAREIRLRGGVRFIGGTRLLGF